MQATWIPEPLVKSLEAFKAAPPNEFVRVTAELSPPSADVGEGSPISVKGKVTVFGMGVPMPVLILMAQRPAETLAPVALAFSLPLSGEFSANLDTTGWEYGQYAFQAVALPLVGAPSWSATMLKSVAEPRVKVSVEMTLVGKRSPVDIVPGGTVYADYTLNNTGSNVGLKTISRKAYLMVGSTTYPTTPSFISDTVVLAAGASRLYTDHSVSSTGMPLGSADAVVWVQCYADHPKLPDLIVVFDKKLSEVKVVGTSLSLGSVFWSDIP